MDSPAADLSQKLSREAEAVCRQYLSNGRKHGRYWVVGDVDNTPGHSLYVRLTGPTRGKGAAGKWTDAATGEHGDLLDLIAANLYLSTLRDTLDEARRFLSLPRPEPPAGEMQALAVRGSPEAARRLWAMGQPIADTLAERYLSARGLKDLRSVSALRFHPNCYYWREDQSADGPPDAWPALLTKVTDTAGTLTGVHRTWLNPQTAEKAPLNPNRKAMGNLLGKAVRIGSPTDILAVGEGLETMLSLRLALAGLPIAAALSGNHLAVFDPSGDFRRHYVAIDNDEAGRTAFDSLAERLADSDLHLVPLRPMLDDFNSDLRKCGIDEMRCHLRPQLSPVDVPTLLAVETG
ncbi:MAG: toprim domain-containing protein [Pseudomonadota bacterium]